MRNLSRPILHLPRTPLERLLDALIVLGYIAMLAVTSWGWLILPVHIPTHYGLSGAPDAYGGKGSLLILPFVSVFIAALLHFLTRVPHIYNHPRPITQENAARQYILARLLLRWLTLEFVWLLCGMQVALIMPRRAAWEELYYLSPSLLLRALFTIATTSSISNGLPRIS